MEVKDWAPFFVNKHIPKPVDWTMGLQCIQNRSSVEVNVNKVWTLLQKWLLLQWSKAVVTFIIQWIHLISFEITDFIHLQNNNSSHCSSATKRCSGVYLHGISCLKGGGGHDLWNAGQSCFSVFRSCQHSPGSPTIQVYQHTYAWQTNKVVFWFWFGHHDGGNKGVFDGEVFQPFCLQLDPVHCGLMEASFRILYQIGADEKKAKRSP